jgi:HEAT repeat protein
MSVADFMGLSVADQLLRLREREGGMGGEHMCDLVEMVEAFRSKLRDASSPEILRLLSKTIEGPEIRDDHGYWSCVSELHRRSDPCIFEACVAWVGAVVPRARVAGADVLSQLGYARGYPFAAQSCPVLERLLGDTEPTVVAAALIALGHLRRGDLSLIASSVDSSYVSVRLAIVHALLARNELLARQTLVELSRDAEVEVRNWATFALGAGSTYDDPAVREALLARLSDKDDETRGEALVGLAERKDSRVLTVIAEELARSDAGNPAIEAATRMPHASLLPALEGLLRAHPDDLSVRMAIEACRSANASTTAPGPGSW